MASDPNLVFIINCLIRPTDLQDLETTGMEKLWGEEGQGDCRDSRAGEGSKFNEDPLNQKEKLQLLEFESSEKNQATFTCSEV